MSYNYNYNYCYNASCDYGHLGALSGHLGALSKIRKISLYLCVMKEGFHTGS